MAKKNNKKAESVAAPFEISASVVSYAKRQYGETLQLKDKVVIYSPYGREKHIITRVSERYAFAESGEVNKKFPRMFSPKFRTIPRDFEAEEIYDVFKEVIPQSSGDFVTGEIEQ